jgi:predicted MPP superfamily phosphohydrolase
MVWWLLFTHLKDWAPDPLEVRHITIPVQGLHPSLEGLTIGQISDLHFNNGNSDETGVTEDTMKVRDAISLSAELARWS